MSSTTEFQQGSVQGFRQAESPGGTVPERTRKLEKLLLPYYAKNNYPSSESIVQIAKEMHITQESVSDWYVHFHCLLLARGLVVEICVIHFHTIAGSKSDAIWTKYMATDPNG